ncbi:hypothetical protein [Couchioplanes azureus]|uniref:hypothetical protein n=1 Tax=Couchioplanes caeruleus TaxID=56438 RepID=UPI0016703E60|nr:hypothetical protein [Couchioplanes caeruleus]GGQ56330.1 hypothetical protein GCM10010166_27250 [Couchioplanes caeruleus subsp. azureus]
MSTDEPNGGPRRYEIDPDPAWDLSDVQDGVLTVELSWVPDSLAGRPPALVASPELVAALSAEGLTGYTTGAARASFDEDSPAAEEGVAVPELVRLIVGDDPAADFFYERSQGLVVSERALALLQAQCRNLTVTPVG